MDTARPKITFLGEEIPWDEAPEPDAAELVDYFKPVKLSGKAIDAASKIVPSEHWIKDGLHSWLSKRSDYVFRKMSSSERSGRLGKLKYEFGFDAEGPVLERVLLG